MGEKNNSETKEERNKRKRARKEETNITKEEAQQRKKDHRSSVDNGVVDGGQSSTKASSLQRKKVQVIVSLFPVALGGVLETVRRSLRSLLLKYSGGIGGVLLAFENVRLVDNEIGTGTGGLGVILNEMPCIHYQVQLDAVVFCPTQGVKLTGVINECFPSHIGMLVNSFFNAMVSSDNLISSDYVFEQDLEQWIPEEGNQALGTGDRVDFTFEKLHECGGVMSIEGSHPSVVHDE